MWSPADKATCCSGFRIFDPHPNTPCTRWWAFCESWHEGLFPTYDTAPVELTTMHTQADFPFWIVQNKCNEFDVLIDQNSSCLFSSICIQQKGFYLKRSTRLCSWRFMNNTLMCVGWSWFLTSWAKQDQSKSSEPSACSEEIAIMWNKQCQRKDPSPHPQRGAVVLRYKRSILPGWAALLQLWSCQDQDQYVHRNSRILWRCCIRNNSIAAKFSTTALFWSRTTWRNYFWGSDLSDREKYLAGYRIIHEHKDIRMKPWIQVLSCRHTNSIQYKFLNKLRTFSQTATVTWWTNLTAVVDSEKRKQKTRPVHLAVQTRGPNKTTSEKSTQPFRHKWPCHHIRSLIDNTRIWCQHRQQLFQSDQGERFCPRVQIFKSRWVDGQLYTRVDLHRNVYIFVAINLNKSRTFRR